MKKIIFKTSKRKRLHFTFDGKNPICSVRHIHRPEGVNPGTPKTNNCKNCARIWKALKKRKRIEYLKSIKS